MSDADRKFVTLTIVNLEAHAEMIVASLRNEGIDAYAVGGLTGGFRAEAPGAVKVVVAEEDHERAGEALERIQQDAEDIDWSQVDVGDLED